MNITTTTNASRVPARQAPASPNSWPSAEKNSYLVAFIAGKITVYVADQTLTVNRQEATRFRQFQLADDEVNYWKARALGERRNGKPTFFDTVFIAPDASI
jgi:hypothetical protein